MCCVTGLLLVWNLVILLLLIVVDRKVYFCVGQNINRLIWMSTKNMAASIDHHHSISFICNKVTYCSVKGGSCRATTFDTYVPPLGSNPASAFSPVSPPLWPPLYLPTVSMKEQNMKGIGLPTLLKRKKKKKCLHAFNFHKTFQAELVQHVYIFRYTQGGGYLNSQANKALPGILSP